MRWVAVALIVGCWVMAAMPLAMLRAADTAPAVIPPREDPILTPEEAAAADGILEQATGLGFPEVRGAAMHASISRGLGYCDLHLADGSWLLGAWRLAATPYRNTPATDMVSVMRASACTVPDDFPWHLLGVDAAASARFRRVSDITRNGVLSLRYPGWSSPIQPDLALPGAALRRWGAAPLGDRLLVHALCQHTQAEHGYCTVCPQDLGDRYCFYEEPAQRWNERATHLLSLATEHCDRWCAERRAISAGLVLPLRLLPLATVLRRECHQWFRLRLIDAATREEGGRWAASALAILDEADRSTVREDIALLAARSAVAAYPPNDAPLAERLAAWHWGPFCSPMRGDVGEWDSFQMLDAAAYRERYLTGEESQSRAEERRVYDHWRLFRTFSSDIDGLTALLGSRQPCRWLEGGTPRLVGDNALRALTLIWMVDPRVLAGRDRSAAWTDAERSATAEAVQGFWRESRGRPFLETILARVERIPPWSWARLLKQGGAADRARLVATLARAWKDAPPVPRDRQEKEDLDTVIFALAGAPGMAAAIRRWPIHGPLSWSLVMAHERIGDTAPLDAVVQERWSGAAPRPDGESVLEGDDASALVVMLAQPTPARIHILLDCLAGDPGSARFQAALRVAVTDNGIQAHQAFLAEGLLGAGQVLGAVLSWIAMNDTRAIAPAEAARFLAGSRSAGRGKEAPRTLAPDLRVCDLALAVMLQEQELAGTVEGTGAATPAAAFSLDQARERRDVVLTTRRQALWPKALEAAEL